MSNYNRIRPLNDIERDLLAERQSDERSCYEDELRGRAFDILADAKEFVKDMDLELTKPGRESVSVLEIEGWMNRLKAVLDDQQSAEEAALDQRMEEAHGRSEQKQIDREFEAEVQAESVEGLNERYGYGTGANIHKEIEQAAARKWDEDPDINF